MSDERKTPTRPGVGEILHWSDGGRCVAAMVVGYSDNPDLPDALTLRTFDVMPLNDAVRENVQMEQGAHGGHPGGTYHPFHRGA